MVLINMAYILLIGGGILFFLGLVLKKKKMLYSGIFFLILLMIGFFLFIFYSNYSEEQELKSQMGGTLTQNELLPVPDRIIYKNKNNEYFIITPNDNEFDTVYTEISNRVDSVNGTEIIDDEKIKSIKDSQNFIELDYNTKSKNKIFPLQESYIGMINMQDEGGKIVKKGLIDKEELEKKVEKAVKRIKKYYFGASQKFESNKKINQISDLWGFEEKKEGVYQLVINNEELFWTLYREVEFSNVSVTGDIDFSKNNVVMTISKYDIGNIEENIGNLKYTFDKLNNEYKVSFIVVSKVVNTNCIYCNVDYIAVDNNMVIDPNLRTQKGIVQSRVDKRIEIGYDKEHLTNIIVVNDDTIIKDNNKNEIRLENIEAGDSLVITGTFISKDNDLEKNVASEISVYKKDELKKEVERFVKDGYRVDGHSILYSNVNSSGNGYIICDIGNYNYIYPVKLKVNSQTETFLGMGMHLQDNYGYILHEICDITLDTKVEDIDNIQGYVKMIEYIAD